jgi:hypothetical protein
MKSNVISLTKPATDSTAITNDIDVFTLLPTRAANKRGVITLKFNKERKIEYIDVRSNKNKMQFKVFYEGDDILLSAMDTTSGAHKFKLMYDSIIIETNHILYQRKFFTKDKRLLSSQIKMINIYGDSCEFISFYPNDSSVAFFKLRSLLNLDIKNKFNNVTKKSFPLQRANSTYYYHNKSLFWHLVDFFFDYSIDS